MSTSAGGSSPATAFSTVLLPQPLGPTMATNSPSSTTRSTSRTASSAASTPERPPAPDPTPARKRIPTPASSSGTLGLGGVVARAQTLARGGREEEVQTDVARGLAQLIEVQRPVAFDDQRGQWAGRTELVEGHHRRGGRRVKRIGVLDRGFVAG